MVKISDEMYGRILWKVPPSIESTPWVVEFTNGMQHLPPPYYSDVKASLNYNKATIW